MKKSLIAFVSVLITALQLPAQQEPGAGNWKTWFITSGRDYRLPAPGTYKNEITDVLARQKNLDAAGMEQIFYWNAGAPGYRWKNMMTGLYMTDTSHNGTGVLSSMLLGVAVYDAIVAAWNTKYAHNRPRPFVADSRIKVLVPKPESPSYPCESSVAAGVAVTIISHFYPHLKDSVSRMAQQEMNARVAAGLAFPSDTRAGFDLGKRIAEKEIDYTKDFTTKKVWDRKIPAEPGKWNGKYAMYPLAGQNRTVVLTSASQFRPAPPPDFAKEMEEMKTFKQTFRSMSNAFFWASANFWGDALDKKIFEHNIHLNPPKAARIYAVSAVAMYDGFVACWDAKYTYWGIRPNQYDTTFRPAILVTPPFPGYPSGHALISGLNGELYSYFFPEDAAYFRQRAKDGAESRFQAGIHFRTDNEVALDMGRKIAATVIQKVKADSFSMNKAF